VDQKPKANVGVKMTAREIAIGIKHRERAMGLKHVSEFQTSEKTAPGAISQLPSSIA